MLTPTIDLLEVTFIFTSALTGFAVMWGISKAIWLLQH